MVFFIIDNGFILYVDNCYILIDHCNMKRITSACLCVIGIFMALLLSNCTTTRQNDFSRYNFSLKDTLSIFLINNGDDRYFCVPIQYVGDYQISGFEFDNGNITVGAYEILFKKDDINISVYLNEDVADDWNSDGEFNLIYLEENGRVLTSKMREPLAAKRETGEKLNHYYIFIEKHLTINEMRNIVKEYEKGNVFSKMSVWYDITIDNELQPGTGLLDNFELYNGPAMDTSWFPPNLNFFIAKYLQK